MAVQTAVLIVLSSDKAASPDLVVIGYHEILIKLPVLDVPVSIPCHSKRKGAHCQRTLQAVVARLEDIDGRVSFVWCNFWYPLEIHGKRVTKNCETGSKLAREAPRPGWGDGQRVL